MIQIIDCDPGLMTLHLVKLCVGVQSVEELSERQALRRAECRAAGERQNPVHVTRMMPRRSAEILQGGSIYWVIKGSLQVRQNILALEPVTDATGIRKCQIVLDYKLTATELQPRRPFQGWRYLDVADAPKDITNSKTSDGLPLQMQRRLRELGAW